MLNPDELATLASVRLAIRVRLWALNDFHHKHPINTWSESDWVHVKDLRAAIYELREKERQLKRR